jgi:hypothetical protein
MNSRFAGKAMLYPIDELGGLKKRRLGERQRQSSSLVMNRSGACGGAEAEGEVMQDDRRGNARQSARQRPKNRGNARSPMLNFSRYTQHLSLLVPVAAVFAVMAAICFAAAWVIEQLQSLRCPAGTFLVGSEDGRRMLQRIPILLASFFLGIPIVEWFVHLTQRLHRFGRDLMRLSMPKANYELRYRTFQRDNIKVSLVVLSIMLPISVTASLSQYCLSQQEILYQPWPWTGLQRYSWNDIARIETSCSSPRSKGRGKGYFDVVMRDGARLEIAVPPFSFPSPGPPPLVLAYPEIRRALDGVAFTFDAQDVRPDCPYAGVLLRRP